MWWESVKVNRIGRLLTWFVTRLVTWFVTRLGTRLVTRRFPLAVAAVLGAATCVLAVPSAVTRAAGATATTITVNGTSAGAAFDGIGAISGGGNTRLLTDYPAAQQQQIFDYLFKPGYGADLQILKTEIGGDTNSTDGSESSIEHTSGAVSCGNGYEFWLMEQAKARNPNIKLHGLAWGAPGWIGGGNFWSTDMISYLVNWLNCAKADGLTINYLGGWNERGYNISWYEQLRSTLNTDGYSAVQVVGADSDWSIATDLASNNAFSQAVQIIGVHYPCQGGDGGNADTCPGNATATGTGKPLWASENGSQDLNSGAPALIRSITRGYVDAGLTAYINWPVVAAIYPDLPYNTDGLVLANQPWSGAYSLGGEPVGHGPGHPVHPARQAVPQLRVRLPGRQRVQRQLRVAEVRQRHRLLDDHRDDHRHRGPDRQREGGRRPVDRRRARLVDQPERAHRRDQPRPAGQHHAVERQLLADRPARLRLHADHYHRAGQGHRGQSGSEHAGPAVLRQLRQRHRGPAAPVPVPDAGRVRGRALRRRPLRPLRAATGRGAADRVGRQLGAVHDRRQPVLEQLHGGRGRADLPGRLGPADRAGRDPARLRPGRGSTSTTFSSATPAPGRSCATAPVTR